MQSKECELYLAPKFIPEDTRPNRLHPYAGSWMAIQGIWGNTPCVNCGVDWMNHKNIGPGWVDRSNAIYEGQGIWVSP